MRRGFTLIETIIYTALISVVLTVTVLSLSNLLETKNRSAARIETEEETNFLMGKIRWTLNDAGVIVEPGPNATSTTLSVQKRNFDQNPVTIELASGVAQIRYAAGAPVPLTSERVIVNDFVFEHIAGNGNPALKVTLSLDSNPDGPYRLYGAPTAAETTFALRIQ